LWKTKRYPALSTPFSLSLSFAGYKWVKWPAPYADSRMLIIIGRDLDGRNLAVGRAMHQGDILPAKVKIEQNIAYVSHGGKEHVKHNFEVNFAKNREIPIEGFPRSVKYTARCFARNYAKRVIYQSARNVRVRQLF